MTKLPHLRLEGSAQPIDYISTTVGGGSPFETPGREPSKHAPELKAGFEKARGEAARLRTREPASDVFRRETGGVVLTFLSEPGYDLKLERLDRLKSGIQLRSVHHEGNVQTAKVYVPNEQLGHFIKQIDTYATRTVLTVEASADKKPILEALADKKKKISVSVKNRPNDTIRARVTCSVEEAAQIAEAIGGQATVTKNTRKNTPLIESIAAVRLAMVKDFWQESEPFPGESEAIWWEVWLASTGRSEAPAIYGQFEEIAKALAIRVSERFVAFPEHVVLLAFGTAKQFASSVGLLSMLSEFRRAKELAGPYLDLKNNEQRAFADDLIGKVVSPDQGAPAVCILDSGINRGHVLLSPALAERDALTVDKAWGTADSDPKQHGTGMAGLALYGCLTEAFSTTKEVRLSHCLESVKFLPPPPKANNPEVYGAITQQAVSLAVINNPTRNRVICMAVTALKGDHGLPSSWSGAVDDLCAGVLDETQKLMFISAGNVKEEELFSPGYRYHEWNIVQAGVQDPAQAWNAITVGAYTDKVVIQDPTYGGYEPVAPSGDLCPSSRTSLAWPDEHHSGWPIKPDLVCEGGNFATKGTFISSVEDLSLLTTILHPTGRLLDPMQATSPATALAARMGARLWSHYPKLRPETVRALLVHSARWRPAMIERFGHSTRAAVHRCLRCYGYGVPDLDLAVYSMKNAVTLIYEGELQPFKRNLGSVASSNEMHLHGLPWPKARLEELHPATPVTMRVTLSYFVEPSPGNVGWGTKFRYGSHGLRFDVIRPLEDVTQFKKRISRAEWDDPKDAKTRPKSAKETRSWVIGEDGRTHGSLHSDWWQGTAAELAACNSLVVYPVAGWWRERPHLGRVESSARYSLVLSLSTPKADIDLYSPIELENSVVTEVLV